MAGEAMAVADVRGQSDSDFAIQRIGRQKAVGFAV
jgi:hypothetical protein